MLGDGKIRTQKATLAFRDFLPLVMCLSLVRSEMELVFLGPIRGLAQSFISGLST
jgi:hypothetical protein